MRPEHYRGQEMMHVVSLATMILFMTASQVLLKFAGLHSVAHASALEGFVRNPCLWAAMGCSAGGICCWLFTLRRMPLSQAYPWTAMTYVITPLAGMLFFAEVLNRSYAIGILLILAGILLTSRRASSP